jgi:hypothetical protein
MKAQIRLDTVSDIAHFVLLTSSVHEPVYIKDAEGRFCVSGKSFLGLAHAQEFGELWCECEKDIYSLIKDFIII